MKIFQNASFIKLESTKNESAEKNSCQNVHQGAVEDVVVVKHHLVVMLLAILPAGAVAKKYTRFQQLVNFLTIFFFLGGG
jgi:hypothetical protein